MAVRATWEHTFGRPAAPEGAPERAPRSLISLIPWEELLTLTLTLLALAAVVFSIERANWVREMPSLGVAALFGLVSGWLLARTRGPAWALHLLGITAGLAVVLAMVMHTMRLSEPLIDSGIDARWEELWARIGAWVDALRSDNVSTDPLPFVLLVVLAAWALAYLAAWAVVRWRNPWFALLPGGVALLTNISYLPGQPSAEFILFLFAGILLFARLHLLRTLERWQGERAATPPMLSLEVLNLAFFAGIALIVAAWLVPTANHWGPVAAAWERAFAPIDQRLDRFGQLFIGVGSKRSVGFHKFGAVLPLQGSITLDNETLFKVDATDPLYLRGAVYDEYTSSGWKLTDARQRSLPGTTVEAASFGTPQTRAQFRAPVQVKVRVVEPVGRNRLLAFGDPLATDSEAAQLLTSPAPEDIVGLKPGESLQEGDTYTTVGTVSGATIDRLVTASPDYPAWVRDRYLQLPDSLPQEVRALARQIVGNERVPYLMAARIEQYLRANYRYELKLELRPPRRDAVAYFLFDAKHGYFDYHASAMAVLLRLLGVPARVAVGFALDNADRDEQTKRFRVSEQRSWAWTEVFFPGYGWVEFNPTPGRGQILRAGDDSAFLDPLGADPNALPPEGLGGDELLIPSPGSPDVGADGSGGILDEAGGSSGFLRMLGWLLAAAALLIVGVGGTRVAWDAAYRRLPPAGRRWAKLQTLAGWAGLAARPEETPLESAAALNAAIRPRLDLNPLARSYVAERYGGGRHRESTTESERLDALYLRARGRLLKRALSRFIGIERDR